MASIKCPFCNDSIAVNDSVKSEFLLSFDCVLREPSYRPPHFATAEDNSLKLSMIRCPSCEKITVIAKGRGKDFGDIDMNVQPIAVFKRFPDYIPAANIADYEEAHLILKLSPKASATLSRRCLQGMIHDFWGIREKNLNAEITALKDKIPFKLWEVIDSVRKIGNVGAHMENDVNLIVDITPGEAEKLLKLLEFLIEQWYVNRHERDKLFKEIVDISGEKQSQRAR